MPAIDRPSTTLGLSIRDAVMAQQSPRTTCRVCSFLKRQSERDQGEWRAMLAEPADVVWHKSISTVMTERARAMTPPLANVTPEQIGRHRREEHDDLPA